MKYSKDFDILKYVKKADSSKTTTLKRQQSRNYPSIDVYFLVWVLNLA
jgi:hypothetical protein